METHGKAPETRARGPRISTRTRLALAFGAILGLFAVALLVDLHALAQMDRAEREDARLDRAKHAGHRVAALVREQYIHQAHTIIERNRSHISHYQDVAAITRKATDDLLPFATSVEEQALVAEISSLVRKNDDDFFTVTLPAIDRGEHDAVVLLHAETEKVVGRVAKLVRGLNDRFEARSREAHTSAERERSRVRVTTLACFGCAAVLAAVMGVLTTRSITRRVSALREGARRLGDGDLTKRISLDGADELAELGASFDEMARRLARHQSDLVRSQKLASIGRLCSGVAHEINGPLGIILGYANVIRRDGVDEEALGAIEQETRQCQRIVEALLDTSRNETPTFDTVDLGQLAKDGVERLRATGKLGNRSVVVEPQQGPVLASGDEAKLRQVILNLLTNAIEATADAGRIGIAITDDAGSALLVVSDDGPGMPASTREHLFDPFFTTKAEGTGLGLAISRAIIDAHRGDIRFAGSADGGTRVEVRLERANPRSVETHA